VFVFTVGWLVVVFTAGFALAATLLAQLLHPCLPSAKVLF
jgi:hypothetical protein